MEKKPYYESRPFTFQDDGSSGVHLTITGADLQGSEKLTDAYFNVNPELSASIPDLTFTKEPIQREF